MNVLKNATWTQKPKPAKIVADMLMHSEDSMKAEGGWSNGDVYYFLLVKNNNNEKFKF